ncbi:alpha/beta hydrolase [Georgenia sp. 10Sc9-8]|uniref:Alpha/beta hydrolase n=1 Tax=Georgenia halotolerans TaxID=3028317 RepID=A0ABT5U0Z2_9MICO|nr:alpha/beta hydrolase [Georgenia halotolerans]
MSAAPTVLLVHGIRASRSMWRRQELALRAAGVPVLVPDLPGHGERRAEAFSVGGALATLEDAARRAEGPVVVAGVSLGGYLAVHWAARTRRRPAAVLAAACSTRPQGPGLVLYQQVARLIGRLPDRGAALNDALAARALPVEALRDLQRGGIALDVMDDALSGMRGVDPVADVQALGPVPVWVVNGQFDHFRGGERRLLEACADGRLLVVPGATHLVSLVAPVRFNRTLLELVDAVGP